MKRVFTSTSSAEIRLLQLLLEQEAVECFARNEQLSIATGSVPFLECMPELWILKDEDEERALDLLAGWKNPDAVPPEPWVCLRCGETNEGQFGACWQCEYLVDG